MVCKVNRSGRTAFVRGNPTTASGPPPFNKGGFLPPAIPVAERHRGRSLHFPSLFTPHLQPFLHRFPIVSLLFLGRSPFSPIVQRIACDAINGGLPPLSAPERCLHRRRSLPYVTSSQKGAFARLKIKPPHKQVIFQMIFGGDLLWIARFIRS